MRELVSEGKQIAVRLTKSQVKDLDECRVYRNRQMAELGSSVVLSDSAMIRELISGYVTSIRAGKPWRFAGVVRRQESIQDRLRARLREAHSRGFTWQEIAAEMQMNAGQSIHAFLRGDAKWKTTVQERLHLLEAFLAGEND